MRRPRTFTSAEIGLLVIAFVMAAIVFVVGFMSLIWGK